MSMLNIMEVQGESADLTLQSSLHWLAAAVVVFLTILAASWGNRLYLGQEILVDYSDVVLPFVLAALLLPYVFCVKFLEAFGWPGRGSLRALREFVRENPQVDGLTCDHPEDERLAGSVMRGRKRILFRVGLALWCTDPRGKKWLMLLLGGVALFCLEMAYAAPTAHPGALAGLALTGGAALLAGAVMWLATGYRSLSS